MTKPDNILFVCTNARKENERESCQTSHATDDLCKALRDEVKERGLKQELRVTSSGCLGPCHQGPHAVLMPADIWFSGFNSGDCLAIIDTVQQKLSKK
jgi:predicted metal-binding protein